MNIEDFYQIIEKAVADEDLYRHIPGLNFDGLEFFSVFVEKAVEELALLSPKGLLLGKKFELQYHYRRILIGRDDKTVPDEVVEEITKKYNRLYDEYELELKRQGRSHI